MRVIDWVHRDTTNMGTTTQPTTPTGFTQTSVFVIGVGYNAYGGKTIRLNHPTFTRSQA
jgi:hypothetical protein